MVCYACSVSPFSLHSSPLLDSDIYLRLRTAGIRSCGNPSDAENVTKTKTKHIPKHIKSAPIKAEGLVSAAVNRLIFADSSQSFKLLIDEILISPGVMTMFSTNPILFEAQIPNPVGHIFYTPRQAARGAVTFERRLIAVVEFGRCFSRTSQQSFLHFVSLGNVLDIPSCNAHDRGKPKRKTTRKKKEHHTHKLFMWSSFHKRRSD